MTDGSQAGVLSQLFRMPRIAPALFATFFSGLLLLFIKELPENIRSFFLPSLVVYAQGAALLGALHRMLGIHYWKGNTSDNEKPIPGRWKIAILVFHLLWFAAFVVYNCFRYVL